MSSDVTCGIGEAAGVGEAGGEASRGHWMWLLLAGRRWVWEGAGGMGGKGGEKEEDRSSKEVTSRTNSKSVIHGGNIVGGNRAADASKGERKRHVVRKSSKRVPGTVLVITEFLQLWFLFHYYYNFFTRHLYL